MDKKWYSAECLGDSVISLGKAGEGEAVRIEIDVSEWTAAYPYAQIKLFVKPPKPGAPYFARIDGPQDGVIGWTLKKNDTQHAGGGVIELMLISGEEVLLKSATARTELLPSPSMGVASDSPPDANETWWEEALDKIDEAKQEAIQSVGALAGTAETAAGRAETAAAKAEAASEHIDETVTDLRHDIDTLADTIAILHAGVPDTSAKAASHELYATDAPMHVTLYGATHQEAGTPSPDSPKAISGVDKALVHVGGKNLLPLGDTTVALKSYGAFDLDSVIPPGTITWSADITTDAPSGIVRIRFLKKDGTYVDKNTTTTVQVNTSGRTSLTVTLDDYCDRLLIYPGRDATESKTATTTFANFQIEVGAVATSYVPYNANVITPPLLPPAVYDADGNVKEVEPLCGNGTVDDTIENDVLSGCDKCVPIDGSLGGYNSGQNWYYVSLASIMPDVSDNPNLGASWLRCVPHEINITDDTFTLNSTKTHLLIRISGMDKQANPQSAYKALLAENPLKVYYRSTDYTPENDIRVCRVTRRWASITLDGSSDEGWKKELSSKPVYTTSMLLESDAIVPTSDTQKIGIVCNAYKEETLSKTYNGALGIAIRMSRAVRITDPAIATVDDLITKLAANPITVVYQVSERTYMTDCIELRKPANVMPVTVTGSGETAVEYAHDTKHYIDSQIAAVVALAMNG